MKVEPIIDLKNIKSIKKLLADQPRNRLLFAMGVNSGLRVQDILALKVSDVKYCKIGDRVCLKEKKTGKENILIMNKEIKSALAEHLATSKLEDEHFLFKSRKGKNYPLTTYAVTMMVQRWCDEINLQGNFGAHTLRKTWCYHQRKTFGVSWELLAKRLNHSSPSITRRYLGVQDEEVEEILLNAL
ncbi:Tyrosine recombinase XerC [Fundidesulfovibrio magnetotacticus]|uniref:Tyrosine recombinase XerC n=1 Tax=Fundidesulfovibrio magnetotacticus TaxID=2730080 RepID=A0A6V8LR51_9BACT|nr:tyrosine-type recombinase/integrase [Fundidesulfovibrio magnetotacticus]GFK92818.1 Tyrosine recombinase XerC [Fundidesulfovibrio magnetotacticus]